MNLCKALPVPQSKLEVFIRTVKIAAFIPGRIRLYSQALIGNATLEKQVRTYLLVFSELAAVEINRLTGSILIQYTPQLLHTNQELTRVETYIKKHSKG